MIAYSLFIFFQFSNVHYENIFIKEKTILYKMRRALLIQRQLLLHSLYSSKFKQNSIETKMMFRQLDSLQYYLWKRYQIYPFYPSEHQYRLSISRFALQTYNPLKNCNIHSNGTIQRKEICIQLPFYVRSDYVKLPIKISNSRYSLSTCSFPEASFLQLLFWRSNKARF